MTGGNPATPIENTATLRWDLTGDTDADDAGDGAREGRVSVDYREAVLEIDNALVTGPAPVAAPSDGGDVARYEIVVGHAAGSAVGAFDVSVTDALPPEFASATLISAEHSASGDISGDFAVTGTTLASSDTFDLAPGETVTLILEGTLGPDAPAGTTIDNEATVTWQSLGDPSHGREDATRANAAGTESTASDVDATGTAFTLAEPTFEHTVVETGITNGVNGAGDVVAGERVVHELAVTVPEGTTRDATITHTLAPGLVYQPGSAMLFSSANGTSAQAAGTLPDGVTLGSGAAPTSPTVVVNGDGTTTLTFVLGDVVNGENDAADETIAIRFTSHAREGVVAATAAANAPDADTLADSATLRWTEDANGDGTDEVDSLTDADTLDVVAPRLIVDNVVSDVPAKAGDSVEYTVTIRHTSGDGGRTDSSADAFDIAFTDTFPAGVTGLQIVSAEQRAGAGPATDVSADFERSGDDASGFAVAHTGAGGFDLALGESVTLVLRGTASDALVSGQGYDSAATATWTTLDGGTASTAAATDSADNDANEASGTDTGAARISLADVTKVVAATGIDDSTDPDPALDTGRQRRSRGRRRRVRHLPRHRRCTPGHLPRRRRRRRARPGPRVRPHGAVLRHRRRCRFRQPLDLRHDGRHRRLPRHRRGLVVGGLDTGRSGQRRAQRHPRRRARTARQQRPERLRAAARHRVPRPTRRTIRSPPPRAASSTAP